ncbi:MAG: SAM-dependent methyltransferase [Pseudomonadota bacterium]
MTTLPTPSADALQHSAKLLELLRHEIVKKGGYITFARFMEIVLYAPGLGYYSSGNQKFGTTGDFLTAPEISALFAKCVARQCQDILAQLGGGDILELGAGSGKFAADLLMALEQVDALPHRYLILEVSADLRAKQNHYLEVTCPHLLKRVHWLDHPPAQPLKGIIFANEVLDALPAHCFHIDEHKTKERCVTMLNERLSWLSVPPTTKELSHNLANIQKAHLLADGYESEMNLMIPALINTLDDILQEGVILLFDYGYGRNEYYHPDRSMGTMMCYYQHYRHTDPFKYLGLQDITTHVDFTSVAETASDAGLTVAGYTTQAGFLLACGIIELAAVEKLSPVEQYQQNQAIKLLTLPAQMGELIKVMALTKQFDEPLLGFSLSDRRKDL